MLNGPPVMVWMHRFGDDSDAPVRLRRPSELKMFNEPFGIVMDAEADADGKLTKLLIRLREFAVGVDLRKGTQLSLRADHPFPWWPETRRVLAALENTADLWAMGVELTEDASKQSPNMDRRVLELRMMQEGLC